LPADFYEKIKPDLYSRIGRELRLARRVLDLGCGSCELVQYLANRYQQEVTGIDVSSSHFPKGRRTHQGVGFRCIRKDAARLKTIPDRSADAVVMLWALHEMDRPGWVVAESFRVLRPGAELLVVDFPKGSLAEALWHEAYFDASEIRNLLASAGFMHIQARLIARRQVVWASGFRPAAGAA